MTDLSPEGRALLKGMRDDLDASPEDRERVGRALAARLGLAAGTIAGGAVGATSASAASATTAGPAATLAAGGSAAGAGVVVASKWVAATLIVAAAGVGGGSIYLSSSPEAPARSAAGSAAPAVRPLGAPPARSSTPAPVLEPLPLERFSPEAAPEPAPPAPTAGGPPRKAVRRPPNRFPMSAPAPMTEAEPLDATVGAETRLLRRADEALRSGSPSLALSLLDEHAQTFPQGVLSEERSAERVTTLCALGRTDEARAEARRFLATTPDSLLANEVRGSCGADNHQDPGRVP